MPWTCGLDYPYGVACWLGNLASLCFFTVYVPQFVLNYRRKSVKGFALSAIAWKLTGSSFLCVNSLFNGAAFPVFLYGLLNSMQHYGFIFQFWIYSGEAKCLFLLLIPVIPLVTCVFFPSLITYTDLVKPICQITSHLPQLSQCVQLKSTLGVSMFGQHLNFLGCVLGLIMCHLSGREPLMTWLLYYNSGFQALSLYFLAIWYHEMRFCDSPSSAVGRNWVIPSNEVFA